jgi:hypothetical protein
MTLEFTQKQYETLLKLAYMGDWMINGIRTEDERIAEYADLAQRIYALADGARCGSFVEFDKKLGQYVPTAKLDEDRDVSGYREQYDNEIFWDELIDKLSLRDFMALQGLPREGAESAQARSAIIKKYVEEFENHGIERLTIGDDAIM